MRYAAESLTFFLLYVVLGSCTTLSEERSAVIAMHDSASAGDLAKCKELVALDPELIRTPDRVRRQVPLHWASVAGQEEVVAWLLTQRVDVDARDRFGSTPLSGAAFAGQTQVAKLLLDHGADANACDEDGNAPLDLAAAWQHLETAKLLVARGAKIEGGPSGMDPLCSFASHGDADGVEWTLAMGARLPTRELENGWTALHWLAKGVSMSREEAVAINLAADGHTAEERSAREVEDEEYLRVFRLLLANGAALDARGDAGETPLHLAVNGDNLAVATALLEAGAEVDPRDRDEQTPLLMAASSTRVDMVRLLATHGADLDAKDHAGFTPLITATRWGKEEAPIREIVEILSIAGADVNARTPGGGWGPAGNAGLTALQQAAESGYLSVVELLLAHGADVNQEFKDGRTPLYWAAKEGHRDVVASLLAHGADVNAHAKGRTALAAAREAGHPEIIDLLLARGARE